MDTFVVHMANEKRFCGKGIGLYVDIGPGYLVHEGTFPDVGITCKDQSPGVDFNGRETSEMLSDLLQICQWIFLSLDNSGHSNDQNSKTSKGLTVLMQPV
jgi:hypothetical protein